MASKKTIHLLTAEEMGRHEKAAIADGKVTGRELMRTAGRGVADAIAQRWEPEKASVLCGPGNNGGDGYVIARLLRGFGWDVACWAWGPSDLPADAAEARAEWEKHGETGAWSPGEIRGAGASLVVDAVFGAGLTRSPPAEVMEAFAGLDAAVVAVDAPTGLCMDSGRPLSSDLGAVRADLTVTFHAPRRGHYLAAGPTHCGEIVCIEIGLPEGPEGVPLVERPTWPVGKGGGHKYDSGHALLLGGGPGRGGAARLAARGALRVGAGLVTITVTPAALQEYSARLDAIMLRPVADPEALSELLKDRRLSAIGLGPGLGTGARTRGLVEACLAAERGVVLDADALTAFAEAPGDLLWMTELGPNCLLTPHDGEFARLFPDIADRLAAEPEKGPAMSRLDAVAEAADRAGCVVLLKGPDTVVAAPDGRLAVHAAAYDRAAPWLATAGAGDVLTGIATGLIARGAPAFEAATTAAWLHVEAARRFGPGLIAEDIPDCLPGVLRALGV